MVAEPVSWHGLSVFVAGSVGKVVVAADMTAAEVVAEADRRMYADKRKHL